MKVKRITFGELKKRFGGLRSLAFNRTDGILTVYNGFVPLKYGVSILYRRKKDCTYVTLTCLGYIDLFRPKDDRSTIVCKFEGKIAANDLTNKDFAYKKELTAVMEELENDWRKELDSRKED